MPNIRFHDLRHTAATMHLGMMTNPKIVQEILGHSTISIMMDAYSHVLPPMHREAIGNINDWLIAHTEAQEKAQVQHEKAENEEETKGQDDENSEDLDGLSV